MEPLGVAVVIPVLNESASIAAVISEIPRDVVREIIVVDGGSSDGTAEIAAAAGAWVIVPGQYGYGRACLAGGAAASIDCGIIAFIDGDGADRGDLIARIVEPIRQGEYDFVIASRAHGERESGSMAWHQLLAGHLAGIGMRVLYGVRYTDMCALSRDSPRLPRPARHARASGSIPVESAVDPTRSQNITVNWRRSASDAATTAAGADEIGKRLGPGARHARRARTAVSCESTSCSPN
jgi:glycosyltransferase involved in cell wall biosynthesis